MKRVELLTFAGVSLGTMAISLGILNFVIGAPGEEKLRKEDNNEKENNNKALEETGETEDSKRLCALCSKILYDDNMPDSPEKFLRRIYEEAMVYQPVCDESLLNLTPKTVKEQEGMLKRLGLYNRYYRKVVLKLPEVTITKSPVKKKAAKTAGKFILMEVKLKKESNV